MENQIPKPDEPAEEWWSGFYHKFYPRLCRFCEHQSWRLRYCNSSPEDIAQDVMTECLKKPIKKPINLQYLKTIAKRKMIDLWRAKTHKQLATLRYNSGLMDYSPSCDFASRESIERHLLRFKQTIENGSGDLKKMFGNHTQRLKFVEFLIKWLVSVCDSQLNDINDSTATHAEPPISLRNKIEDLFEKFRTDRDEAEAEIAKLLGDGKKEIALPPASKELEIWNILIDKGNADFTQLLAANKISGYLPDLLESVGIIEPLAYHIAAECGRAHDKQGVMLARSVVERFFIWYRKTTASINSSRCLTRDESIASCDIMDICIRAILRRCPTVIKLCRKELGATTFQVEMLLGAICRFCMHTYANDITSQLIPGVLTQCLVNDDSTITVLMKDAITHPCCCSICKRQRDSPREDGVLAEAREALDCEGLLPLSEQHAKNILQKILDWIKNVLTKDLHLELANYESQK